MSDKKIFVISMPRTASTYLFNVYTQYNSPNQFDVIVKEPFRRIHSAQFHQEQIDNIYNAKRCVVSSHATQFAILTEQQKKFLFTDCTSHFTLLFRRSIVDNAMSLVRSLTVNLWHTLAADGQVEIKPAPATPIIVDEVLRLIFDSLYVVTHTFSSVYGVSYDNIIFKEDLTYDPKIDWFNSGYCGEAIIKLNTLVDNNPLIENPPIKPFLSNYDDVYTQVSDAFRSYENKNIEIKDGIVKHLFGKT